MKYNISGLDRGLWACKNFWALRIWEILYLFIGGRARHLLGRFEIYYYIVRVSLMSFDL